MKVKEMIGKIYKACLTKEALAALEAKTLQAEEQERLEFIENNGQQLVQLSLLAQTILDTLIARLEIGKVVVSRRYSSSPCWEVYIYDQVAEQQFDGYKRGEKLIQRNRVFWVYTYTLCSPIAFSAEEGSTLLALFMEHYYKERPRLDAEKEVMAQKAAQKALADKYMGAGSVTKE